MFATLIGLGFVSGLVIALLGHPGIGGAILSGRPRSDDHDLNDGY
ncbi:MAG: hypothetical protein AAFQ22_15005 [Pseudomonadota bacterium]